MNPPKISVFEYDKLRIGDNPFFTKPVHQALEHLYFSSELKYFNLIPCGVQFREFVGVIQVNGVQIEILPKLDRYDSEKSKWRDILIGMLHEVGLFRVSAPSFSSLTLRSNSILELYFELFISEVEYLVRTGLIKQYRRQSQNQTSLKGSLDFPRHLTKNLVHQERFFTNSSIYDQDHLWHQILSQTIDLIRLLSQNSHIHSRIGALKLSFPDISPQKISERSFDSLVYNRKTESYRTAMEIARLLLCNYHPDLKSGRNNVLALMFDMNILWESFIYHSLRKQFIREGSGWVVSAQRSTAFWSSRACRTSLRPDILIETGKGCKFILDTKWKHPVDNKPSSTDLQQLFAYSRFFDTNNTALVYPGTHKGFLRGDYAPFRKCDDKVSCSVINLEVEPQISEWQATISKRITDWIKSV